MATYDFRKLGDVEALESVPENANALVEVGGDIKRVPGSNLGGGGGIPTAILKLDVGGSDGKSVASLRESRVSDAIYTATCDNMTFAEVKALMLAGEPVNMILAAFEDADNAQMCFFSPAISTGYYYVSNTPKDSNPDSAALVGATFGMASNAEFINPITLYWYEDGTITSEFRV